MAPIGVIVGMALSIYAVVMQFGRPDAAEQRARGNARRQQRGAVGQRGGGTENGKGTEQGTSSQQSTTAAPAHPPNDGPPPASTRRETECL